MNCSIFLHATVIKMKPSLICRPQLRQARILSEKMSITGMDLLLDPLSNAFWWKNREFASENLWCLAQ